LKEVLDTRFFIEHFYAEDANFKGRTSRKLQELTTSREGVISTITLAEVAKFVCEQRGKAEAEVLHRAIVSSGLSIRAVTAELAGVAGVLKCKHPNVPMGDCIIAATAQSEKARIVSDDPHFDELKARRTWI